MGYSKAETIKKQKNLVSKSQRYKRKVLVNMLKVVLLAFLAIVIAGAGAVFGMMKGILDNAPDINQISIMPKGFKTFIYDENGNPETEISTIGSNRVYVYYEDIPKDFINAFVAIEDERYWTHNGIDVRGIARAFVEGAKSGNFDQGASTITQQLIKNEVFNVGLGETTFMDKLERKIQEQYLAMELEKKYSKEQIIECYLNTIYLGRGVNGIQAASAKYFNKNIDELTVSEMATIAGITQNPTKYDPTRFPEESAKRRKRVLDKMLQLEYITQAQYDEAMADDVFARIAEVQEIKEAEGEVYSYYTDKILVDLENDFMELYGCTKQEASQLIFTGGYSVYSVQDKEIQKICEDVVNDTSYYGNGAQVGLDYDLTILDSDGETAHNYSIGHLLKYFREKTGNSKYNNIYPNEEAARAAADEFKEAMLIRTGGTFSGERFSTSPQPQFSFTIMDHHTGYVKAIVGGRGEKTTNRSLDRATDSPRQPGSTFKILAAYLPLIDACGGGLAMPFTDEPLKYTNGVTVHNWWGASYRGPVTVRKAIQDSMNIIAVKAITVATPELAYQYLVDLGLTTIVDYDVDAEGNIISDINQATALGGLTRGVTTYEMTGAYGSIANGGLYVKPVVYSKVIDHDGNVVIDNTTPTTRRVMKETTAWQLIEGMKSVLNGGTGGSARMTTGISCAGKTGTTSNTYDLWFCGMTPYYTASIWMGFDSNINMGGYNQSLHCRMWRDIMDQIAVMEGQDPSVDFVKPDGITTVSLCQITGKLPGAGCPTFTDYYAAADVPGQRCPGHATYTFCRESKCIATSQCPDTVTFVMEVDEETGATKLVSSSGEDSSEYAITDQVCPLHPELADEITISSAAGEGGTISPSVTCARGSSVTFYITPNPGYSVMDVMVNGQSVGPVTTYTFNEIQENASISVAFTNGGGGVAPQPTTTEVPTEAPTEAPTVAPTEAPTEAPVEVPAP